MRKLLLLLSLLGCSFGATAACQCRCVNGEVRPLGSVATSAGW